MKGNYIAKNMNIVNRNSVHKNKKKEYMLDDTWKEEVEVLCIYTENNLENDKKEKEE